MPKFDMTVATTPLPFSRPAFAQECGDQRHKLIPVDAIAIFIGHNQTVGVTVQRDAKIGLMQ